MDRVEFFNSIQKIKYPNMIVEFFDHFVALRELVKDNAKSIIVSNFDSMNGLIEFTVNFSTINCKRSAIELINNTGSITMYEHPMIMSVGDLPKKEIVIRLQG